MRNTVQRVLAKAPVPCARPRHKTPVTIVVARNLRARCLAKAVGQLVVEAVSERPSTAVACPLLEADASLRAWIENHGGNVWDSLRIVEHAPCGSRGVISNAPLPLDIARAKHLIVVPEHLYMTADDARELLQPLDSKRFSLSFWRQELPSVVQLALLLALERQRGNDSFWAPYVRSLPAAIPCAWALAPTELQTALATLGPGAAGWERAVAAARQGVYQRAERAVHRYGKHLPAKLSVEDVVWAMGQVLSRSFGRDPDVGLAPYIDLCNHRHGAPRPGGFVNERDGEPYAFVQSSLFGEPHAMAAGNELYVSYAAAGADSLTTFLNLGFVPQEMLPLPPPGKVHT